MRLEALADLGSILRLHIIGIAMAAALVFGWLFTGEYPWAIALVGGLDWLLINLLNRITDLEEDLANEIRGTERVARHLRGFTAAWVVIQTGSFAWTLVVFPELTWLRVVVQVIGLGYSVPLVPTLRGLRRFKDLYFFKNFMSAALFVLTVFIYPLAVNAWTVAHPGGWAAVALLAAFFVAFEITYEILYDLRDLEGDRLAKVPTYPVVHGAERSRQIIDGLLALSVVILAAGVLGGLVGLKEGLMLAAPAVQLAFYRPRFRRGLTRADCINLTHLGTALLLFYLLGTRLWAAAGLPDNVFLVG